MPGLYASAAEFGALAQRLKDAGETGLRRRMYKAISDAGEPLAAKLKDPGHLKPYMPDRYALILAADLVVRVYKRAGANPSVSVRADTPRPRNRAVIKINAGLLRHPVFASRFTPRRDWEWKDQYKAMMPGFFDSAVDEVRPQILASVADALRDTRDQIAGK
jgi:hypothetical protein